MTQTLLRGGDRRPGDPRMLAPGAPWKVYTVLNNSGPIFLLEFFTYY